MEKNKTLSKISALRARAGTAAERKAADNAIKRICEKYGIDELSISLDDPGNLPVERHEFKWKTKLDRRLLAQCIACQVGFDATISVYGHNLFAYMTEPQAIEVDYTYSYYRQLFQDEIETLYIAFLHKHDIFPPNSPCKDSFDSDLSRRLMFMMEGLSDSTLRKALTEGD